MTNVVGSGLPSIPDLVEKVLIKPLDVFQQYLVKNRAFLAQHPDFDNFVDRYIETESESKEAPTATSRSAFKSYRSAMTLLGKASDELRRVLWSHEV